MTPSHPVVSQYWRNYTKKSMHCNLSLSSRSCNFLLRLIWIDSVEALLCARSTLRHTLGAGVRNRAPNKGDKPVSILFGDVVNLVYVGRNAGLPDALQYREFTPARGIDFIYNESKRSLKIRVRYARFLVQAQKVLSQLNVLQLLEYGLAVDEGLSLTVIPGTVFERLGNIVEVITFNEQNVLIRDNLGHDSVISVVEANRFIEQYIS